MDTPSSVLQALRRESLDIYNRLHSIAEDSKFVTHVREFYPEIPLVPNLRCGAWYTDPTIASNVPAYFKSTDGHFNNWSFNLRRSNLHLLAFIVQHKGILLVDSTRAGKRIPDALSKTVPIWCTVINRAILLRFPSPERATWDTALYTPPGTVSEQEHHQIELRLDAWAQALYKSSFELPPLPAPLRPLWITPATTTFPVLQNNDPPLFLPIICISASRLNDDSRRPAGFAYIQGSGDDHELWGMGLTPAHFWRHMSELLAATRSDLPELVKSHASSGTGSSYDLGEGNRISKISKVYDRMAFCTFTDFDRTSEDENVAYILMPTSSKTVGTSIKQAPMLVIPLAPRIKTHLAHIILPRALPFIDMHLRLGRDICVVCGRENPQDDGGVGDEGVAVVLAALVIFFDDGGDVRAAMSDSRPISELEDNEKSGGASASQEISVEEVVKGGVAIPHTDKARIRTCLEWIISCRPGLNPARTTLKRLNEYLMSSGRK